MPYLTFEEYQDFGFGELEEDEFDKLLPRASDVLNSVTRSFYEFNDINDDVEFRRNRFKRAVAAQIKYFDDMGATTMHELEEPSHVQIGRTTMSTSRNRADSQDDAQDNLISGDALMYLRGTGLLYRGVGVRSW